MKLHIGGTVRQEGWTNLDIERRPEVDIVASCTSMPMIGSNDAECVYASHVLEHLDYQGLSTALHEIFRVLAPGGSFMLSVPDLAIMCWMYTMPHFGPGERYALMNTMFGGGEHRVGLSQEYLAPALERVGFQGIQRVDSFGIFPDFSDYKMFGVPISLNMVATKPSA